MANTEIKEFIKKSGLTQWKIADFLQIHENTLVRRLRYELSPEEKQEIYKAIEELKKGA